MFWALLLESSVGSLSDDVLDNDLWLETPENGLLGSDLGLVLLIVGHGPHLVPDGVQAGLDHLPSGLVTLRQVLLEVSAPLRWVRSSGLEPVHQWQLSWEIRIPGRIWSECSDWERRLSCHQHLGASSGSSGTGRCHRNTFLQSFWKEPCLVIWWLIPIDRHQRMIYFQFLSILPKHFLSTQASSSSKLTDPGHVNSRETGLWSRDEPRLLDRQRKFIQTIIESLNKHLLICRGRVSCLYHHTCF